MTYEISIGKIDDTWKQHDIFSAPLTFGNNTTAFKAIIRKEELVAIVKQGYGILPNEEAVKAADEAADLAGLKPFHEFKGDWFQRMDKHVIITDNGHRIHALYCHDKHYTVQGEKMHVGVGIHNSIDGSTSFGCGIFTFRHACANMVLAGTRRYHQDFDQRKTLEGIFQRHTAQLTAGSDNLKTIILTVMERSSQIIDNYNRLAELAVTEEMVEKLKRSRLSKTVLPDYIAKPEEAAKEATTLTQWQLYNDLTALIWHNAKAGLRTKEFQFNTLHAIIKI